MPVEFRSDETLQTPASRRDHACDRAEITAGLTRAAVSTGVCLVVAAVLLPLMLRVMRASLIAADKLRNAGGDHDQDAYMPLFFFAAFGAIFGCLVTWRMSSSASVGGAASWIVGGAAVLVLLVVGAVAAGVVFSPAVPFMCWLGLIVLAVGALGGMGVLSAWLN